VRPAICVISLALAVVPTAIGYLSYAASAGARYVTAMYAGQALLLIVFAVAGTEAMVAALTPAYMRVGGYNNDANSPDPFDSIARMKRALPSDALVGAGTVLRADEIERVQAAGGDRVEPSRRLVEEEDVRVERERARQSGALRHAAADLRGVVVLEA